MKFYKNTKTIVSSPDNDTDFFDIVAGIHQGDLLALSTLTICLDYILQTSIDLIKANGFTLKMARSIQYPAEIDRHRLHRWPSVSHKYTSPSQIPTA